jgi:hypothetical protein
MVSRSSGGGAYATSPHFKPDVRISRIRLTRMASVTACTESSECSYSRRKLAFAMGRRPTGLPGTRSTRDIPAWRITTMFTSIGSFRQEGLASSVVGFLQAELASFDEHTHPTGLLHSAGVTPFPRYYEPLRLPVGPGVGYFLPNICCATAHARTGTPPGTSGFRRFCWCPLSPTTPESPFAAYVRCLANGDRLHDLWHVGHSHLRNEAESGSRLRITADTFASSGFAPRIAPTHAEVATWRTNSFPRPVPFN